MGVHDLDGGRKELVEDLDDGVGWYGRRQARKAPQIGKEDHHIPALAPLQEPCLLGQDAVHQLGCHIALKDLAQMPALLPLGLEAHGFEFFEGCNILYHSHLTHPPDGRYTDIQSLVLGHGDLG